MKIKQAAAKKAALSASQRFLGVSEIKQDTLIMKDGTLRAVLMVSSINFALKMKTNKTLRFRPMLVFLNSLDHPLQVVIQSRELYIQPYLQDLQNVNANKPMNCCAQIADYRSFVTELVEMGEIMSKNFYAVVPYDPLSNKQKKFFGRVKRSAQSGSNRKIKSRAFYQT